MVIGWTGSEGGGSDTPDTYKTSNAVATIRSLLKSAGLFFARARLSLATFAHATCEWRRSCARETCEFRLANFNFLHKRLANLER